MGNVSIGGQSQCVHSPVHIELMRAHKSPWSVHSVNILTHGQLMLAQIQDNGHPICYRKPCSWQMWLTDD